MFRPETVSFRGHLTMANKPDYNFFKFLDDPQELRMPKEIKRTSLELIEEKEDILMSLTGSKYFLGMEDLIHEQSHPEGLDESEGKRGRRKIYFKKNTVDAFMPEMVAFFQYTNSNFVKDDFEDREVISRRDDCLIERFEEDDVNRSSILDNDLERNNELSSRESLESMSSKQNESIISEDDIHENETIKEHVYEKLVIETKEIPNGFDHSAAETVNETQPVKEPESTIDDKRKSTPQADEQESPETEINFQAEERIEEISQSHVDQRGPGESRAIVSNTYSCQIEGKEPVQHCCSNSFRSSISHASSHSFAFPVLSSEWTGSPARIPGSERRKLCLRRRRRVRIFCCKF